MYVKQNLEELIFKKLKKIKWEYLANRRETLLFISITDCAYKYFQKVTGLPWRANFILRFSDGEFYHCAKELDELKRIFSKGGIKILSKFKQNLKYNVKNFDKLATSIQKVKCSKLNKKSLLALLQKYFRAALMAHKFLLPMVLADGVISKIILETLPSASNQNKQEWLGVLTYPLKENEHTKEERSFYQLAWAYKNKDQEFERYLKSHLRRFSWIGARGYWWEKAWKRQDILERLQNFVAQRKNPLQELRYLDGIRRKREMIAQKLLKKWGIKKSSSFYKIILLAKEYAYLRTLRTDLIYGAGYKVRNLFYEIGKRANISPKDVQYLTFLEFEEVAKNQKIPITKEELRRRKDYFVTLLWKDSYTVFSARKWQKKFQNIIPHGCKISKEIRGNIAFPGRARGIVRLVFTNNDIKKIKQGDILVAIMTFPNFISAMERAGAFITDEGGILCHAAIVARELKKPCIIGTKIATKVLKDGDLVEVDANNGIIKKI